MNTTHLKKQSAKHIISILSVAITTFYPILFLYFQNIYEARERHLIAITAIYILFSSFTLLLTQLLFRNLSRASMFTNGILVIVYNFEFAVSIFSNKTIGYVLISVFSVILLGLLFFLSRKMVATTQNTLNSIWAFTLLFLLLVNFIPVAPYMMKKIISHIPSSTARVSSTEVSNSTYTPNDKSHPSETTYPNVYLMIFDEYGGTQNLEHYYGYDNTGFLATLEDLGFNISHNSYNRESISTITNVPNLLNLDYVVRHETEAQDYLTHLMNPYLYTFFKERGYDINTSSYPAFLDNTQSTLNYDTKELYEDTVGYYILKNSLFIHIYDKLIAPNMDNENYASSSNTGSYLIQAMEYYKGYAALGADRPHFNLGYFSCPHVPICYKSDGTPFSQAEVDSDFAYCYIEYLKWTSSKMTDIVQTILEADPESIIIIMSDHGSRSINIEADSLLEDPYYYKENILNCVYVKGKTLDISGLSGINTMIAILNDQYETHIDYKEYE